MKVMAYKGNIYGGATTLEELTDVNVNEPSDGQILKYDEENEKWVNDDLSKSDVGLNSVDNTSDADKPISTATQAALNNKANASDIASVKEVTGNPISISDGSETYADELVIDLEPIQSGSGTPSPSNVRPIQGYDIVSVDRKGINVWDEQWEVGDIDATTGQNKTASIYIRAKNYIRVKPNETYYFKVSQYSFVFKYNKNKEYLGYIDPSIKNNTFTVSSDTKYIRFVVGNAYGTTYNNDISINYPSTDTSYHAFNGQTVSLQLGNKNLLPMTVEGIKAANTDGTWSGNVYTHNGVTYSLLTNSEGNIIGIKVNGTATASVNFWLVKDYTFKPGSYIITDDCALKGNYQPYVFVEGSTATNNTNRSATYITNVDIQKNIGIWMSTSSGANNVILYPMIRDANVSDPTFSPYNPTLGGMVYGGQLTIKDDGSAVFVGDRACKNIGELNFELYSADSTNHSFVVTTPSDAKPVANNGTLTEAISSSYEAKTFGSAPNFTQYNSAFAQVIEPNRFIVRDANYTSASAFKTAMASQQIVYPLATPFTLHLSTEQLKLLQGTNNVWSNAGDVTLKYQPDNVIAQPKADVQRLRDDVDDRLVGNASKNLLNLPDGTYSNNGVTAVVNKGIVTLSGTAGSSGQAVITFASITYLESGQEYILNGCAAGGSSSKYYIQQNYYDESDTAVAAREYGAEETHFTAGQTKYGTFYIVVAANVNVDNVVLKPMIRRAGITDGSYEEYYPSNRELWEQIDAVNVPFTGATSSADGAKGLVPAPTSSNREKYLKADGTWGTPTNNAVTQTSSDSETYTYRVLLSGSNNDTTKTEGVRKTSGLRYQPSTANLLIGYGGSKTGEFTFYTASNSNFIDLHSSILTANRAVSLPDASGTISVSGSSSIKTKKNITDMTEEEASKLLSLRPVNYDYKNENNGTNCYGFIAEEVQEVGIDYPVFTTYDEDLDEIIPALDYAKFVPYLVKVVQMQQKQIEALKSKML